MKVPPHEFVRGTFLYNTFRLPVLEQPEVHYAQKIEMMYEQLIKNIKKIVKTNFF